MSIPKESSGWCVEMGAGQSVVPIDSCLTEQPYLVNVQEHYRDTIEEYRQWSPEGNLHYGYWRPGINPLSRRRMLEEMNHQVFGHLKLNELNHGKVADLGCGVGGVSRLGCRNFPQLEWHAMNIAAHQILEACHHYPGDPRIKYYCSDYHQLPWPRETIDGAFFMESLCYSMQPQDALREAARVLRPGARLVITDGFLIRPLTETSALFRWLFANVSQNWAVPAYHQIQQLDQWLSHSGLKLVSKHDFRWQLAPSALQSIPLTVYCAIKLLFQNDKRNRWRWRQLKACALSLLLGLQKRSFRYYLIVLEKSEDTRLSDLVDDVSKTKTDHRTLFDRPPHPPFGHLLPRRGEGNTSPKLGRGRRASVG